MNNTHRGSSNAQLRDSKLRAAVESAVFRTIFEDSSFIIDIPKLSAELWDRVSIITPTNKEENERLEFLGDTLMDSSIAIDLYKNIPDGTPHKYTILLNVLHANLTFCHLARKMKIEFTGHDKKSIGDIFEAIVGAYYTEKGFEAVHAWANRVYEILIREASMAFDDCLREIELSNALQDPTGSPKKGKGRTRGRSFAAQSTPPIAQTTPQSPSTSSRRPPSYPATDPPTPRVRVPSSRPDVLSHAQRHPSSVPESSLLPSVESSLLDGHTSTRFSSSLSDSDEEPLEDFWEKVAHDGRILFVNHLTKTTTWEDPRHTRRPSFSEYEEGIHPDLSWRARLIAGDPDEEDPMQSPNISHIDVEPFPDLFDDGYVRDDMASAGITALPDFWEERQGEDGWTYYIDHVNTTYMRKDH